MARARTSRKMASDWIDALFEDQFAKWRDYLRELLERTSLEGLAAYEMQHRIDAADTAEELHRIGSEIMDLIGPPNDPRRQLAERFKTWNL